MSNVGMEYNPQVLDLCLGLFKLTCETPYCGHVAGMLVSFLERYIVATTTSYQAYVSV